MRVRIIIYPQAFSNNYYLFKGEERDSGAREKGPHSEPLGTTGRDLGLLPEEETGIQCQEEGM